MVSGRLSDIGFSSGMASVCRNGANVVGRNPVEQRRPRTAQAAHHSPEGNIEYFRGLHIAEAGKINDLDDFAIDRLDLCNSLPHGNFSDQPVIVIPNGSVQWFDCRIVTPHFGAAEIINPGVSNNLEQIYTGGNFVAGGRGACKRFHCTRLHQI